MAGAAVGGLAGAGVHMLLVGTATHAAGSPVPDLPTVPDTMSDLAVALVECCGADRDRIRVLIDPASPLALGRAIADTARQAEGLFLFCYAGHGLVSSDGELHLATRSTEALTTGLGYTALRWSTVRTELAQSRASSIVVIVDCCFSGRADVGAGGVAGLTFSRPPGAYVLASAAPEEIALAPDGERHTAFLGELIRLLRAGDPVGPAELTLDQAYRCLDRRLPEQGRPRPQRQADGRAGDLLLTANAAYRPRVPGLRAADRQTVLGATASPYPGLLAFGVEDARFFFGREALTSRLMALVEQAARRSQDGCPVVVVGPSGAGKSSLLRAGLVPALEQGLPGVDGSHSWPRLVLTPGAHPISELAARLAGPAGEELGRLRSRLAGEPDALTSVARAVLRRHARRSDPSGRRVVLIVDQFEEIFTACEDSRERQAFVDALCSAAAAAPDGAAAAVVVLGLRADFYGQCAADHRLARALQEAQLVVTPLTSGQLRAAIERPAERAGLLLEPGLSELLIRDLGAADGAEVPPSAAARTAGGLPLLAHALLTTWQQRDGDVMTLAGYQATGGIREAVSRTAEGTYHALSPDLQETARRLLLRMVRVAGSGSEDTRRPLPLADFAEPADNPDGSATGTGTGPLAPPAVARVLNALAAARLVTLGTETAEITHDALLHAWPRLRQWISADRADLLTEQQLIETADAWEAEGRDPATLYRGSRLESVRPWAAGQQAQLPRTASAFLAASNAAARRRTRLVRGTVAVLSVLLLLSAAATAVAVQQRNNATRERTDAVRRAALLASRDVARRADAVRNQDPALALQLALTAYRSAPTEEARASLLTSSVTPFDTPIKVHTKGVNKIAYSADGRTLASTSGDRLLQVVDVTRPGAAVTASTTKVNGPATLAFSPAGPLLAVVVNGAVRLLDATDPGRLRGLSTFAAHTREEFSVAVSRDGRLLAIGGGNGSLELWNVADPSRPVAVFATMLGRSNVYSVAFSPDRQVLATASEDGSIRLWDVTNGRRPVLDATVRLTSFDDKPAGAVAVSFSPRRHLLAAAGAGDAVRLWQVGDPRHPVAQEPPFSGFSTDPDLATAFSPDGQLLVTGSAQGVTSYSLGHLSPKISGPLKVGVLPGDSDVVSLAYSPDGSVLATGTADGVIHQWRTPLPVLRAAEAPAARGGLGDEFSPDGQVLAAKNLWESTIQLWDMTDPYRPRAAATLPIPSVAGGFVGDGRMLVSIDSSQLTTRLWDATDPRRPTLLTAFTNPATPRARQSEFWRHSVDIDSTRHLLALASERAGVVQLWDIADPRRPRLNGTLAVPPVEFAFFAGTTRSLVVGFPDGSAQLFDMTDPRRPVAGPSVPDDDTRNAAIAVSRTGLITTQSPDDALRLWSITAGNHVRQTWSLPKSHTFAVDTDHHVLAVAGGNTARVLDITDPGHPATSATPPPTSNSIEDLVLSPDGRRLAATSGKLGEPGTLTVWDVAKPATNTIAAVAVGEVPGDPPAFSPDGELVVIGGTDAETLRVVDLDTGRLVDHLCALGAPTITRDQWDQHLPDLPYDPPCT